MSSLLVQESGKHDILTEIEIRFSAFNDLIKNYFFERVMIVKEHSKLVEMLNYSKIIHFLFLISRFSRLVWNQQMCISYSRRRKDWWWCYKERFFFEVQHQTGLLSLLLCCHLFHLPKGLEELVFMAIHHPSQYPTWYSILSPWPKGFGTRSFSRNLALLVEKGRFNRWLLFEARMLRRR